MTARSKLKTQSRHRFILARQHCDIELGIALVQLRDETRSISQTNGLLAGIRLGPRRHEQLSVPRQIGLISRVYLKTSGPLFDDPRMVTERLVRIQ